MRAEIPVSAKSSDPVRTDATHRSGRRLRLIGIGEILWDHLPTGRQMGGAPANFACHARALSATGSLVSRVGNDDAGREILKLLQLLGVGTECIATDPWHPTGRVTVDLDPAGQPSFRIQERVAWDHIKADKAATLAVSTADAVCFGSLAQRSASSRASIARLLRFAPPSAVRIFDVNLRQGFYSHDLLQSSLAAANAMKLNDEELPVLASLLDLHGSPMDQLTQLARTFSLRMVAYTRGSRGSLLFCDGQWSEHPGIATQVRDTVGAGDSFTAAATLGLLAGWPVDEINRLANEVAAHVCSCEGATPAMPARLHERFRAAVGA